MSTTSQKSANVEIKVGLAAQTASSLEDLDSLANNEEIMQRAVAKRASFDQTFDETVALCFAISRLSGSDSCS